MAGGFTSSIGRATSSSSTPRTERYWRRSILERPRGSLVGHPSPLDTLDARKSTPLTHAKIRWFPSSRAGGFDGLDTLLHFFDLRFRSHPIESRNLLRWEPVQHPQCAR